MSAWHWPQYVMALFYASGICVSIVKAVYATNKPSTKLMELAEYTLHAGGFW